MLMTSWLTLFFFSNQCGSRENYVVASACRTVGNVLLHCDQ